jgi:trimeric autotransporter adhesin
MGTSSQHLIRRDRHGSRRRRTLTGMLAALVASTVAAVPAAPASAQAPEPTMSAASLGQRSDTAAVSCWDIKQRNAAAPSGSYWLVTPRLRAPQRFFCDMTTDGGGWVLIGRGRDGWNFSYNGQGTPDEVRGAIDGPAAFDPRALSAQVVDGLLNGGRPDQLAEGIRLRRATTADGAGRQEVRFRLTNRDRWAWTFDADHRVGAYSFDGVGGTGGLTRSFGADQALRRVQAWGTGWGLGETVTGTPGPSSYVVPAPWGDLTLSYTQVWIRPRLTAANTPFALVPDAGLPGSTQRRLISNHSLPTSWGVTGLANGQSGELNTEVQAFTQSGNRMIVGGNFEFVQQSAGGANRVRQPFLAAFDVNTGAFLSDFRPVLDNQVKALHTLPNGTVVAGGEFTTANGQPAVGLVALDPVTGATVTSFRTAVENEVSVGETGVSVRAFDAQGPWLYVAGRFTHHTGPSGQRVFARNGVRLDLATGNPDATWNPNFNGTAVDVDASDRGDRVYFAGYFTQSQSASAPQVAVVSTAAGASLVPNLAAPRFSAGNPRYQQAILEVGARVWHGGAEHMLFSYARDTFALLSGNVTQPHGDFQAIAARNDVVYAGCHCGDFNYSEQYTYYQDKRVDDTFTQADNIGFVGAWDQATGRYLPDFVPGLRTARGHGSWAIAFDTNGTMWTGGDFDRAQVANGSWQWVGGFARLPERDSTAPTRPGGISRSEQGGVTTLTWGASTDNRGPVTYEVIRDDRVIATTTEPRYTLPVAPGGSAFFVRAVDGAGNRSATTPMFLASRFQDVRGNVHAGNIEAIAVAGVTTGCNVEGTRYCPDGTVTREQMATFLVNAFNLPPTTQDFFDDDATSNHQGNINRLAAAGITSGSGAGGRTFNPRGTVTREQMATFLAKALSLPPRPQGTFTDVGGIHAPNVNAIAAAGITTGCNAERTRFCPGSPVGRAPMATFLNNAMRLR